MFAPGLGLKYFLTKFVQLYCNQDNLVFVLERLTRKSSEAS